MFVVSVRERGKEAHKFTFRKRQITVGRLRVNDIILPKRNISKRHAKFEINPDNQIMVYDMGSTNGTFVNGARATTGMVVGLNDKVFVGDYILQLQLVEDKSAIDLKDPLPGGGYSMPEDSEGDIKATIAHLDTKAIQEELRKLGYRGGSDDLATSTVMIDPGDIPSEPPPLGELDEEDGPAVGSDGEMFPVEVENEESVEVEMPMDDPVSAPDLPPDLGAEAEDSVEMEEELDIPLVEDEAQEEPPVIVKPVAPPAPMRSAYTASSLYSDKPAAVAPAPAPAVAAVPPPSIPVPMPFMRVDRPVSVPPPPEPVAAKREPAMPAPTPVPAVVQAAPAAPAAAPAVALVKQPLPLRSLDAAYDRLLEAWQHLKAEKPNISREDGVAEVERLLDKFVADVPAAEKFKIGTKLWEEFSGRGPVWEFLAADGVAEVFVGGQGAVRAYGRNGEVLSMTASLSCARASSALAESLLPGEGERSGTVAVPGGAAFVLLSANGGSSIRLVKTPGMSTLAILEDRRVLGILQATKLRLLVEEGTSVILLGGGKASASVVQALSGLYMGARRLMMVGPGWAISGEDARVLVDSSLLFSKDLLPAINGLGIEALFGQSLPGLAFPRLLSVAGGTGVPFVASLNTPNQEPGLLIEQLMKLDNDLRSTTLFAALSLSSLAVVTMTKVEGLDRVDSIFRLTLDEETQRPVLSPLE